MQRRLKEFSQQFRKHKEFRKHNKETLELWEDFRKKENRRVPITFESDENLWLSLIGRTFREFYTDPSIQLEAQLIGQAWMRFNIFQDKIMGIPEEAWVVIPRFWHDEAEFFGCEIIIQENDFAWPRPISMDKKSLLSMIANINPVERLKKNSLFKLYKSMEKIASEIHFMGHPVKIKPPLGHTNGIFTVAQYIRGAEQISFDLLEDPEFIENLLLLVTDKIIAYIKAWYQLTGEAQVLPFASGWGMADDALTLISGEMYERFVLPHHERIYSTMTMGPRGIHLCGKVFQHYKMLYEKLNIRTLDGPGPLAFVDVGKLLTKFPLLSINAQVNHTTLKVGPVEAIDKMMKEMLNNEAKKSGRLQIEGDVNRDTPLEYFKTMYEAGKKYGECGKC